MTGRTASGWPALSYEAWGGGSGQIALRPPSVATVAPVM